MVVTHLDLVPTINHNYLLIVYPAPCVIPFVSIAFILGKSLRRFNTIQ